MTINKFYKAVIFQLESSQAAYEDFQSKSHYLNAKTIYTINRNLLNFIISHSYLILEEDRDKFQKLVRHFSGWMNQFEFEEKARKPDLDSNFIFERIEGSTPYPVDFYNYLKNRI